MAESGITNSPHVDEGTMHAWLDGALSPEEASAVESHVAHCDTCSAAAAEARGLIAASTRILSALDGVPGGVIPGNGVAGPVAFGVAVESQHVRSMQSLRRYAPIAAVALFAIAATLVLRRDPSPVRQQSTATVQPVAKSTDAVSSEPRTQVAGVPAERLRADRVDARPSKTAPSSAARVAAAPDQSADAAKRKASVLALRSASEKSRVAESLLPAAAAAGVMSSHPSDSVAAARRVTAAADRPANVTFALPQSSMALSQVIVTGVATADAGVFSKSPPTMTGARVVSSTVRDEGSSHVRRTVFQIDSGATVTLAEYGARRNAPTAAPVQRADTSSAAAHLSLRSPSAATHSVRWMASDGTLRVLSGPLSEAELEALKKRIVP